MKKVIIILWAIISPFCMSAQLRPHIKKIVKRISEHRIMNASYVGIAGERTKLYLDFEKLRDEATIKELVTLTNNTNLVVKGYVAWALADRNYDKLPIIFDTYLKFKKEVEYFEGCLIFPNDLADLLYSRTFYRQFSYKFKSIEDSLANQQIIRRLDSVYLYSKNRNEELSFVNEKVFENNNQNEQDYARIKQIALEENNLYAIIALAKYKKPIDRNIVIHLLFSKLESNTSVYEVKEISVALLNFEDEQVKKGVQFILKSNKENWSRGNWSTEFIELAKKYDLKLD